jgi:hypothetical protein
MLIFVRTKFNRLTLFQVAREGRAVNSGARLDVPQSFDEGDEAFGLAVEALEKFGVFEAAGVVE